MIPDSSDSDAIDLADLFWCVNCHNAILENEENCHSIDRVSYVGALARRYRTGWCRDCWRKFHAIDTDDKLALHEALEGLTSLREIDREPVVPIVDRALKEKAA